MSAHHLPLFAVQTPPPPAEDEGEERTEHAAAEIVASNRREMGRRVEQRSTASGELSTIHRCS